MPRQSVGGASLRDVVVLWLELCSSSPKREAEARVHGDDMSTLGLIPALASPRLPYGVFHFRVDMIGIVGLGGGSDFNSLRLRLNGHFQASSDVFHLCFDHEDGGCMADTCIWARYDKEVGEARHSGT